VARTYDEIDDHMREWIARQPMFFVASAPLAADGHVNVSPKGPGGTLRVLGPRRVAYLDYVGSGALPRPAASSPLRSRSPTCARTGAWW
jgi:hypothetical protein